VTVRELIERLREMDPNAGVYFAYDYGDRGHTRVAGDVTAVQAMAVERSAYHQMMKVSEDEDADRDAVVLS
jgi:hypothetical protein